MLGLFSFTKLLDYFESSFNLFIIGLTHEFIHVE